MMNYQRLEKFTDVFLDEISRRTENKHLLLVSGGSLLEEDGSMDNVFGLMYRSVSEERLSNLTISLVDERWGFKQNHPKSNWASLMKLSVINHLKDKGVRLHPIMSKDRLDSGEIIDFMKEDAAIHTNFIRSFGNAVSLVLGIGDEDGHIAGILPHGLKDFDMFNSKEVIAYDASVLSTPSNNPHRYRLTMGFELIRKHLERSYLLALGERDLFQLSKLDSKDSQPLYTFPAGVIDPKKTKIFYSKNV